MAASDYVPIFFKNRLHLAGRPQMSSRPSWANTSNPTIWKMLCDADSRHSSGVLLTP
jgi:hypothetical protein